MQGRAPGFLSTGGSNVMVSVGGDQDIMSHWATSASTSWIPKKANMPVENHPVISTGYVKNLSYVDSPPKTGEDEGYISTYRKTFDSALATRRAANGNSHPSMPQHCIIVCAGSTAPVRV